MGRASGGNRSTGAGSTTLPLMSLYATAANGLWLREVSVFNTTTTAVSVALRRLTTAGTQGASVNVVTHNSSSPAIGTLFNTHTVGPTITAGNLKVASLGAAIGSGVIWTFGDMGILIPIGTANGIGIVILTGTGQICDIDWTWDY